MIKRKIISVFLSCLMFSLMVPLETFGAVDIAKANEYAKNGHEAYTKFHYLEAAQLYEKAYKANPIQIYKDNYTVAYTNYAFNLANDKKYDEAIAICNSLLKQNINNQKVKELLCDIYYSQGSNLFYNGDLNAAKIAVNNSVKYSLTSEQKQNAQEALINIDKAISQGLKPLAQTSNSAFQDESLPAMISIMETKIYGRATYDKPLIERIKNLEIDVFAKNFDGETLLARVEKLQQAVIPEMQKSSNNQQYSSSSLNQNNYVDEIIDQSNGRVIVYGQMPIKIFIDDADCKIYKKFYKDSLKEAFNEWTKASEGTIEFDFTNNPQKANIVVEWNDNFEDFPWRPELKKTDINQEEKKAKYRKANVFIKVGSVAAMAAGALIGVPVLGSIGSIGGGVASPILQYKGMGENSYQKTVKICTSQTEGLSDEQAKLSIKQIATHQIGHAIGIIGHSPDPNDIMAENFTAVNLSARDINTIKYIYNAAKNDDEKN
ncbi:MAG: matrixin family metalloprotease [Candidatus Gastranaerophilales bacterium]|nr:matrixin family metalloprotease [Candidatus Gastranaerophilales bacterium]